MKLGLAAALSLGLGLMAATICGCVTEEIPPPAIHTSAYVTSQADDTPEDTSPIVNTLPAFSAAPAKGSAQAAPAAAPSASSPPSPIGALSTPPPAR